MGLNETDSKLIAGLQAGLPLVAEPYRALAEQVGMEESQVRLRIQQMNEEGIFGRFGVIVRHRELGYTVAAMVVWDVPDDQVREAGRRLAAQAMVNLCYRRPRRKPHWPYNLFTMLHGRSREEIDAQVEQIAAATDLNHAPHDILYTRQRFKQRGPRYFFADGEAATE